MISIKAYNREIEQLIDNGLYDDAIAHSIHILVTYPKCLDAYRNLGKSLLEQKKYPEALDVFSRVLSAIPDDFISHVGLSIIFEDQNNLDLSIWHMEQAFDVQPSNLAIQDELKRLFGLRDGEQPTKIRLTRGALVRMYARGELFQQAISEILAILQEDPRRIDLEVIMAQMHYFSGAVDDAEADCIRILEKIPFCFEANRILHQININKNDIEAAEINKNRLTSLDPYYQFFTSPFAEAEIPENKVLIERLDYIPSTVEGTKIPDWLEDINISTENKPFESMNWINDLTKTEDTSSNSIENPFSLDDKAEENNVVNSSMQSDDEFPEWMKNAGWNSNSDFDINKEPELSNATNSDPLPINSELPSNDLPTENTSNVTNEDLASLFTELKEGIMTDENLSSNANEDKQFPPSDWMSQFSNSNESVPSDSSDQDFPDWLKNFQAEEPQNTNESDDIPDWLKDIQSEIEPTSQPSDELPILATPEDNVPEETTFETIFQTTNEGVINNNSAVDEKPQSILEEDDGWENDDFSKSTIVEPVKINLESEEMKPISSDDSIPDWVKTVLINQNSDDQTSVVQESEPDQIVSSKSKDTAELSLAPQNSSETDNDSSDGIISQQTNDELLDWLRGLKAEETPSVKNDETLNSFEASANIEPMDNQEFKIDDLPLEDFVQLNEPFDQNSIDREQITQFDENIEPSPIESEIISEPFESEEQTAISTDEYSEIINDLIETPTEPESISDTLQTNEPLDERLAPEINPDTIPEISSEPSFEEVNELISKKDFDTLSAKVSDLTTQSQEIEPLLSAMTSASTENDNNFAYWQCLGDLYSKKNQLNDALFAYQKAEDILIKTIS